ncbi:MAG TPA: hypothetical protein VG345_14340 [Bryobacteraceae bacterium]|nr:hypothetical protein [Bryobacteraceae bacterium]
MKSVSIAFLFLAASLPAVCADAGLMALENIKLADSAMTRQQNDRALSLAKKSLSVLEANPAKPAGLDQADWDKRRTLAIGTAHWIAGVVEANKNEFFAANKDLRAALPVAKDRNEMYAADLFFLGLSNYQIGRQTVNKGQILEGAKFSQQCAAIPGQYQERAFENAKAMRKEAAAMR